MNSTLIHSFINLKALYKCVIIYYYFFNPRKNEGKKKIQK